MKNKSQQPFHGNGLVQLIRLGNSIWRKSVEVAFEIAIWNFDICIMEVCSFGRKDLQILRILYERE